MARENQNSKRSFVSQDLGPELMFYDNCKDEVHVLNQTARVIWEGLGSGKTEKEMVVELQKYFSVGSDDNLLDDIRKITEELNQKELLKEFADGGHEKNKNGQ